MNLRRFFACRRLRKSLRPNPDYRDRRLAQFDPKRKARYFDNVRKAGL